MFLGEIPNTKANKPLYDRCVSLLVDYFNPRFKQIPELWTWAFMAKIQILQLWKLQSQLKYYKESVDLTFPKNKEHYKKGLEQLKGDPLVAIDWQFIDFKDTREFKHNIKKKYVVKRNH